MMPSICPSTAAFEDIGRHHAQKYLRHVARALTRNPFFNVGGRSLERQQLLCRFTVDIPRADRVNDDQTNEDRSKRRRRIKQQRLAAERTEIAARTDARDTDDDRRRDQRHDDHLQRIEKDRADVLEDRDVRDAEDRRVDTRLGLGIEDVTADDPGHDDRDQDLPVQLELAHSSPR